MDVKAAGQPALSTANVQQAMHKELRFFRAFLNVDVLVFIIFIGLLSFLGVIVVLTMNLWVFRSMVWPLLWGLLTSAACWPAKEWVAATTVTIVTEPAKCADAYLALLISPWTLAQQAQPSPTKRKANAPRRNPCMRCTVTTMKFTWKSLVIGVEGLLYCVYVVAVYAIEDARRMLWLLLVLWSAAATCYFNLTAVLFTLQILVIALVLSVVLALLVTVPRRIGASGYCVVLCRIVSAITGAISSAVRTIRQRVPSLLPPYPPPYTLLLPLYPYIHYILHNRCIQQATSAEHRSTAVHTPPFIDQLARSKTTPIPSRRL